MEIVILAVISVSAIYYVAVKLIGEFNGADSCSACTGCKSKCNK